MRLIDIVMAPPERPEHGLQIEIRLAPRDEPAWLWSWCVFDAGTNDWSGNADSLDEALSAAKSKVAALLAAKEGAK